MEFAQHVNSDSPANLSVPVCFLSISFDILVRIEATYKLRA